MRDLEAAPDRGDKRAAAVLFDELADAELIAASIADRPAKELDGQGFSGIIK
jgi:hypothetical protein